MRIIATLLLVALSAGAAGAQGAPLTKKGIKPGTIVKLKVLHDVIPPA